MMEIISESFVVLLALDRHRNPLSEQEETFLKLSSNDVESRPVFSAPSCVGELCTTSEWPDRRETDIVIRDGSKGRPDTRRARSCHGKGNQSNDSFHEQISREYENKDMHGQVSCRGCHQGSRGAQGESWGSLVPLSILRRQGIGGKGWLLELSVCTNEGETRVSLHAVSYRRQSLCGQ